MERYRRTSLPRSHISKFKGRSSNRTAATIHESSIRKQTVGARDSAFDAAGRQSADEESLADQIEQEHGERSPDHAGHHHRHVDSITRVIDREPDHERAQAIVL